MLNIPCPWCGPRDETEFHYGHEAGIAYPENRDSMSDEEWGRFVFYRANPKGWHAERWVHSAGCRRWFNVWRNTVTNEFGPTYKPFEAQPKSPA